MAQKREQLGPVGKLAAWHNTRRGAMLRALERKFRHRRRPLARALQRATPRSLRPWLHSELGRQMFETLFSGAGSTFAWRVAFGGFRSVTPEDLHELAQAWKPYGVRVRIRDTYGDSGKIMMVDFDTIW